MKFSDFGQVTRHRSPFDEAFFHRMSSRLLKQIIHYVSSERPLGPGPDIELYRVRERARVNGDVAQMVSELA